MLKTKLRIPTDLSLAGKSLCVTINVINRRDDYPEETPTEFTFTYGYLFVSLLVILPA